jgi:hypothetical protein
VVRAIPPYRRGPRAHLVTHPGPARTGIHRRAAHQPP